ncbi:MAG TPA: RidA family protein [Bacillota bacterium]|nr:RidA family protein [Bacillota bacterium]
MAQLSFEAKVKELGIAIPEAAKPLAAYVPAVRHGGVLYVSGQLPSVAGQVQWKGKVGRDVSPEDGYKAARLCALNALGAARAELGSLDRIVRVLRVGGFVNSAPGFTGQPGVVNGASELLGEIFGDAGKHARAALAAPELPLDAAVEIEFLFAVE